MDKLFYPAIFQYEDNGRYSIYFPDIEGCVTCGDSINNAYEMAVSALGLTLSYLEEEKQPIPSPSDIKEIVLEENQYIAVIEFDMLEYKKKNNSRAVKKTLTIPEWLNEEATALNVNFSQILQEALISKINSRQ